MTGFEDSYDVIIVGAGVSGLRAGLRLQDTTDSILVLESEPVVGGRVRTFEQDGFQLDRGFQVLLTAYPEVAEVLDLDALDLGTFTSGALIWNGNQFQSMIDPSSHPLKGLRTVYSGPGCLFDYIKALKLRVNLGRQTIRRILQQDETTTRSYLDRLEFSDDFINKFFQPFLSGIFLEDELDTSSRLFKFVYKMFAEGEAALPSGGMQAIPRQLASRLPEETVNTGVTVDHVEPGKVTLDDGRCLSSRATIVTAGAHQHGVSDEAEGVKSTEAWNQTACLYYSCNEAPVAEPILMLNGQPSGLINNLCLPSRVCPDYSPRDRELLSVSTTTTLEPGDEGRIRSELKNWFGEQVAQWTHLTTINIPRALPEFTPPTEPLEAHQSGESGLFVCGDHRATPSLNGALKSGRKTAERVLDHLGPGDQSSS